MQKNINNDDGQATQIISAEVPSNVKTAYTLSIHQFNVSKMKYRKIDLSICLYAMSFFKGGMAYSIF